MNVVCIRDNWRGSTTGRKYPNGPKKGEIYTVIGVMRAFSYLSGKEKDYYLLAGFTIAYCVEKFRPVDLTYGPAICEIIEKQHELEEAEKQLA